MGLFSRWQIDDILSFCFQKTGFDISYKLLPLETIYMKYLNQFSGKNTTKIFQYVVCWKLYLERYQTCVKQASRDNHKVLLKGSIFLKNRQFIIQERFN